jgi:uncharacterized protein
MTTLYVHSTKFDGSLHYRYPVRLIDRSAERLITYCEPGAPIESYRGSWTGQKRFLSFFWLAKPYVLHIRWEDDWQPEFLYIDIASNTSWRDGTARYIDLDLDLILRPESPVPVLADEDEFQTHSQRWNYPQEVIQQCHAAVAEVRRLLESAQKPFSISMFTWRPDGTLEI